MNVHTKTYVLKNGQETFNEIKKHLQSAKHFIHMEYYMFHSDSLGKEIIDILIKKQAKVLKCALHSIQWEALHYRVQILNE